VVRTGRFLLAGALVVVAALGSGAGPAQAAAQPSRITLRAAGPIVAGGQITLSGVAGSGGAGNAGTVRLYFRRYGATAFTLITSAPAAASGRFMTRTRQTTSGYWKAVYGGNAGRRPVTSGLAYAEARAWRDTAVTRFTGSGTGDYRSDVLSWSRGASAKVSGTGSCPTASEFNFLRINWTGHPTWGYSTVTVPFTGVRAAGASFLYPDETTGYVEIATQDGCSWAVTITQTVRAYVKV
jgi:hypothetical protein